MSFSASKSSRKNRNGVSSGPIRTLTELSQRLDIPDSTLSDYAKRWPFARRGPWAAKDLPSILRWIAESISRGAPLKDTGDDPTNPDDVKELRKEKLRKEIRKLHAQADQAETALARERGHLLDAGEVENEWASIGVMIRNAFQNLSSQLVPLALSRGMPHEAAAEFGQEVDDVVAGVLRHLSRDGIEDDETSEGAVLSQSVPA